MVDYINIFAVIIFLSVCAVQDIRYRSIAGSTLITGACFTALVCLIEIIFGKYSLFNACGGLIAGCVFVLLARISREGMGLGDGLVLCICGPLLGIGGLMMVVLSGLLLAAVIGGIAGIARKRGMKQTVPFVPFLLAGALGVLVLNRGAL